MTTEHKPHSEWQGVRARIVAALNHPELVPPQADDETINLVNEAWAALHDGWKLVTGLEEQLRTAQEGRDGISIAQYDEALQRAHDLQEQLETARSEIAAWYAAAGEADSAMHATDIDGVSHVCLPLANWMPTLDLWDREQRRVWDSNPAGSPDPAEGLPPDLVRILRDPTITIDRDHEIRLADGRTLFEHLHEWRNAPTNTASASLPAREPGGMFEWRESHPVVTVPCKHCNGTGSVSDVSQWPPTAPCSGCKGAGVHLLTTKPETAA